MYKAAHLQRADNYTSEQYCFSRDTDQRKLFCVVCSRSPTRAPPSLRQTSLPRISRCRKQKTVPWKVSFAGSRAVFLFLLFFWYINIHHPCFQSGFLYYSTVVLDFGKCRVVVLVSNLVKLMLDIGSIRYRLVCLEPCRVRQELTGVAVCSLQVWSSGHTNVWQKQNKLFLPEAPRNTSQHC